MKPFCFYFWSALIFSEVSGDIYNGEELFLLFTNIFRGKRNKTAKSTSSKETKSFGTRSFYVDTVKKWHAAIKRLPTPELAYPRSSGVARNLKKGGHRFHIFFMFEAG